MSLTERLARALNRRLAYADIRVTRATTYGDLLRRAGEVQRVKREAQCTADDLAFLSALAPEELSRLMSLVSKSHAQLKQDLFVLLETRFLEDGFFVEFGATNGKGLSNTFLLEKEFGWRGILSEPAKSWHDELLINRNCSIEFDCVWCRTGDSLLFNEVQPAELSTLAQYSESDEHDRVSTSAGTYHVKTVSLVDMLARHNAPEHIDYLSIDTEGTEYDILSAFDFTQFDISVITVEHNYTKRRQEIYDLLVRNGFVRKHEAISKFDDWYVKKTCS